MTLRCECSGMVECQGGTPPGESQDGFHEIYKCQACGKTGYYFVDKNGQDELTGCLRSVVTA